MAGAGSASEAGVNDIAIALLSAEIKQLVAIGALGIVLVVLLIAASLYNNTRVFGKSQAQAFAFQERLLKLYERTDDVQKQQTDIQRLLSERIEQSHLLLTSINDRTEQTRLLLADQSAMLQNDVARVINHVDASVLPAITNGFTAQSNQIAESQQALLRELGDIASALQKMREMMDGERQFEREMAARCDSYWRDSMTTHEKLLAMVEQLSDNVEQMKTEIEHGTSRSAGDAGDDRVGDGQRGADVHQHPTG